MKAEVLPDLFPGGSREHSFTKAIRNTLVIWSWTPLSNSWLSSAGHAIVEMWVYEDDSMQALIDVGSCIELSEAK